PEVPPLLIVRPDQRVQGRKSLRRQVELGRPLRLVRRRPLREQARTGQARGHGHEDRDSREFGHPHGLGSSFYFFSPTQQRCVWVWMKMSPPETAMDASVCSPSGLVARCSYSGRSFSSDEPWPFGPRQVGQLSALPVEEKAVRRISHATARFMTESREKVP